MPGAREMPTDQEADARVRAGALPGGLVRPLGAKASGSEGLRERGCVAGPQTAPGRQMCPVLKCFWPIPPCRHSAEPGQPRPLGPPMHTGAPGSCPPPAGLDHKLGKQCALGALQPSSPGPLLIPFVKFHSECSFLNICYCSPMDAGFSDKGATGCIHL